MGSSYAFGGKTRGDRARPIEGEYCRSRISIEEYLIPGSLSGAARTQTMMLSLAFLIFVMTRLITSNMSEEELVETMNGRAKAIRCIKANAQPILLPKTLARPDLHNLGIDQEEIEKRARMISDADDFHYRVGEAISNRYPQKD